MKSDDVRLYVTAVLVLQAASTVVLWLLNVLSVATTAAFEVLLAANLVAFAIVMQAYRNPGSIAGPSEESKSSPMPHAASGEGHAVQGSTQNQNPVGAALSPVVHLVVPILSVLVLLTFAVVLFLPSNRDALPPTSTEVYIPVYLVIVVLLVFGSMYLFKRLLDTETPPASGEAPAHA